MFLYNFLLAIILIIGFPYFYYQRRKNQNEWVQRFGDSGYVLQPERAHPIWFHAASVGEVRGIVPLVQELRNTYPNRLILLSTMTRTGQETAKKELEDVVDHIFFVPLDFKWACQLTLLQLKPDLLIITETELWPNLIQQCVKNKCRVVLVNGRISVRSIGRYRILKWFFSSILKKIDLFLMQTEIDAERIQSLGAPPEQVFVMGNTKSDTKVENIDKNAVRKKFGIPLDAQVIVAGSTRPGEEDILLAGFRQIQQKFPKTVLCLAPRHLDRLEEVVAILNRHQFDFTRRTPKEQIQTPVFLLDTMGELRDLYAAADIAFVGGTLVPIGGHNVLEPAGLGVPVLFGTHTANVQEAAEALVKAEGGFYIKDSTEFAGSVVVLLRDPPTRIIAGKNARQVLESQRGVSRKIIERIKKYI